MCASFLFNSISTKKVEHVMYSTFVFFNWDEMINPLLLCELEILG